MPDASLALTFGLGAALSWGASDFSGGFLTRRAHVLGIVLISQAVGLLLLLFLALGIGEPFPSMRALAWGAAAGMVGFLATLTLFRTLALGNIGIAAPVIGMLALALPTLFGIFTDGLPKDAQLLGFAFAALSIWVFSSTGHSREGLKGAVGAGLGLGLYLILLDQAGADSVYWPLATARAGACSLAILTVLSSARQEAWQFPLNVLSLVITIGVLDVMGNIFFVLSAQAGRLAVAAVLSSLCPAVTVALACIVLREPLTREKTLGISLSLVAMLLIAV